MSELSLPALDTGEAAAEAPTEAARLRELLVRYHHALATVKDLSAALLDAVQPDAEPITPEQARAYRHSVGEALVSVERGEAFARDLWGDFEVERRTAPTSAPLPRAVKQERRRRQRKGPAA